jgi:hypothetical protein
MPSPLSLWTSQELTFFKKLDSPVKIQTYLNRLSYDADPGTRSPRWIMREEKANCFEGALFAAAALRVLGYPPLLVDMRAQDDDDHVVAIFKRNRGWGCVAKSNFTVIRFREPVYRTVRELVMSFFDMFFNSAGEKTLRDYSPPFNLSRFDRKNWMTTDEDLGYIGDALDRSPHRKILTRAQVAHLEHVDPDLVKAGLLGANPRGLFKPDLRQKRPPHKRVHG